MDLAQLLEQIRDQYVSQFTQTVRMLAAEPGLRVLTEVALRDEHGSVVREGMLDTPVRVDAAVVPKNGPMRQVSIDSNHMLDFEPVRFDWAAMTVELMPFPWDGLTLSLAGLKADADFSPLVAWFDDWFRIEDETAGDSNSNAEQMQVPHWLSDPAWVDGDAHVTVDLGTSPVAILEALLDVLVSMRVRHVTLSTTAS